MTPLRSGTVRLLVAICALAALPARAGSPAAPTPAAAGNRVFAGHVRTMDDRDTVAEAVAVDGRGVILAVGTEAQAMKAAGSAAQVVRLQPGQALLPGFIEPHMHVVGLLQEMSGLVGLVGACRPAPYTAGEEPGTNCFTYIGDALHSLKPPPAGDTSSLFIVGIELDPSRQPLDANHSSQEFKRCPAQYIEQNLSATRPVLIVDQSGHFGYVNHVAFDKLQEAQAAQAKRKHDPVPPAWPPSLPGGGEWNRNDPANPCTTSYTGPNQDFTGLLTEIPAYNPFFLAIKDSVVEDMVVEDYKDKPIKDKPASVAATLLKSEAAGAARLLRSLREVGLTTITSFAQSPGALTMTRLLAELPASGTRMLSVVTPGMGLTTLKNRPVLPACDPRQNPGCRLPRDLGVNGIKTIADGSTQGCTAALSLSAALGPQYLATSECSPPEGRIDYKPEDLASELQKLWQTGLWRFETHANGNRTIDMVLRVYAGLQASASNRHTVTLIHATVGDAPVWQTAGSLIKGSFLLDGKPVGLRLHFSHLIGHVAYWGAVFERQLGAAAANIDPVSFDREQGIPFSLHSDAPVSVPNPLWFIRQAVTRETWTYPALTEHHVLGPQHAVTVREALRAVTIDAAREKELDGWIGSIEPGKVADFVVLSQDPAALDPAAGGDPTKISDIKVIATYLGGQITGGR
jgi:predicted amidohydrolase YtcJ